MARCDYGKLLTLGFAMGYCRGVGPSCGPGIGEDIMAVYENMASEAPEGYDCIVKALDYASEGIVGPIPTAYDYKRQAWMDRADHAHVDYDCRLAPLFCGADLETCQGTADLVDFYDVDDRLRVALPGGSAYTLDYLRGARLADIRHYGHAVDCVQVRAWEWALTADDQVSPIPTREDLIGALATWIAEHGAEHAGSLA